jgi:hypothetical protein
MEAKKGICQLKDMVNGTQQEIPLSKLLDTVVSNIDGKELDFYSPMRDFVIEEPLVSAVSEEKTEGTEN